jgi:hypothetical protein
VRGRGIVAQLRAGREELDPSVSASSPKPARAPDDREVSPPRSMATKRRLQGLGGSMQIVPW